MKTCSRCKKEVEQLESGDNNGSYCSDCTTERMREAMTLKWPNRPSQPQPRSS